MSVRMILSVCFVTTLAALQSANAQNAPFIGGLYQTSNNPDYQIQIHQSGADIQLTLQSANGDHASHAATFQRINVVDDQGFQREAWGFAGHFQTRLGNGKLKQGYAHILPSNRPGALQLTTFVRQADGHWAPPSVEIISLAENSQLTRPAMTRQPAIPQPTPRVAETQKSTPLNQRAVGSDKFNLLPTDLLSDFGI